MSSWHKTSQYRALSVSYYQHNGLRNWLPPSPHRQSLTQWNRKWSPWFTLPNPGLALKDFLHVGESGEGRAGSCLYFPECVLPGRHVCLLALRTFMWPERDRRMSHLYMCVWLSLWESTSLFLRVPQIPSFWKVTLSWFLICVLLSPLQRAASHWGDVCGSLLLPCRHAH